MCVQAHTRRECFTMQMTKWERPLSVDSEVWVEVSWRAVVRKEARGDSRVSYGMGLTMWGRLGEVISMSLVLLPLCPPEGICINDHGGVQRYPSFPSLLLHHANSRHSRFPPDSVLLQKCPPRSPSAAGAKRQAFFTSSSCPLWFSTLQP